MVFKSEEKIECHWYCRYGKYLNIFIFMTAENQLEEEFQQI